MELQSRVQKIPVTHNASKPGTVKQENSDTEKTENVVTSKDLQKTQTDEANTAEKEKVENWTGTSKVQVQSLLSLAS